MKKYNNLWDKICNIDNFKLAYKNATRGKKYYTEVKEIEKYGVDKYLVELLEEVVQNKYTVSEYTVFTRFTGDKVREIFKLPMKDRIIQHAIMIHIEPIFRETFILDTYSSIKGRGIHRCLKRVKKSVKDTEYKYCLKLDIHKCYPSLDKNILKQKLSKKFKDKKLLYLLYLIIDSCENGVPIGNYTSQYFNNFYFNDFDHWIKEVKRIKYYFRYCDDIVILGKTKEQLRVLLQEIYFFISSLHLQLKDNYQIFPIEARSIDFLGYKTRQKYVLVRKRIKKRFVRKCSKMNYDHLSARNINVIASYNGIMKHGDCRHLWKKYIHKNGRL